MTKSSRQGFFQIPRFLRAFSSQLPPIRNCFVRFESRVNELMESKGGKKKSSSSSSSKSSLFYEAPLGYSIEDIRPNGGIKKFRSAAYSNCARKPS
ncbi:adenosylmethionine decarboxylase [Trifolium repens]|nr:adenosylmethionine decarboxylase [Trifolium repens]WJX63198.1 adenosylmethionine decarboxylase [Trifolium repens]